MNNLDEIRKEIDYIDEEMIKLFKKRMDAVRLVALYKIENNKPIFDESREKTIIEKNLNKLNDENLEEFYSIFYAGVLDSSKKYQKKIIESEK